VNRAIDIARIRINMARALDEGARWVSTSFASAVGGA
jgi:hypothetical protein